MELTARNYQADHETSTSFNSLSSPKLGKSKY